MKRLSTGLIISVVWLALLFSQSFPLLWLVFTIIGGVALHEYYSMCLSADEERIKPMAIVIGIIPFVASLGMRPEFVFAAFFISLFASALLLFSMYGRLDNGFLLLAKLCVGLALISLGSSHLSLLVALPHGVAWLAILSIITIASDTGAYYAGSNYGKTKLCPAISPAKTVEGLLGGMIASVVLVMIARSFLLPHISAIKMITATIVVTLIGVGGDLTESIIKRSCKVKDSGTILPGHGGVLDRIDSLLTAAPALYYFIILDLI